MSYKVEFTDVVSFGDNDIIYRSAPAKSTYEYPDDLIGQISQSVCVMPVNALQLAEQAGSSKCVNVVMIGRLAQELEIPYDTWIQALRQTVPEKFLELNLRAFELGFRQE